MKLRGSKALDSDEIVQILENIPSMPPNEAIPALIYIKQWILAYQDEITDLLMDTIFEAIHDEYRKPDNESMQKICLEINAHLVDLSKQIFKRVLTLLESDKSSEFNFAIDVLQQSHQRRELMVDGLIRSMLRTSQPVPCHDKMIALLKDVQDQDLIIDKLKVAIDNIGDNLVSLPLKVLASIASESEVSFFKKVIEKVYSSYYVDSKSEIIDAIRPYIRRFFEFSNENLELIKEIDPNLYQNIIAIEKIIQTMLTTPLQYKSVKVECCIYLKNGFWAFYLIKFLFSAEEEYYSREDRIQTNPLSFRIISEQVEIDQGLKKLEELIREHKFTIGNETYSVNELVRIPESHYFSSDNSLLSDMNFPSDVYFIDLSESKQHQSSRGITIRSKYDYVPYKSIEDAISHQLGLRQVIGVRDFVSQMILFLPRIHGRISEVLVFQDKLEINVALGHPYPTKFAIAYILEKEGQVVFRGGLKKVQNGWNEVIVPSSFDKGTIYLDYSGEKIDERNIKYKPESPPNILMWGINVINNVYGLMITDDEISSLINELRAIGVIESLTSCITVRMHEFVLGKIEERRQSLQNIANIFEEFLKRMYIRHADQKVREKFQSSSKTLNPMIKNNPGLFSAEKWFEDLNAAVGGRNSLSYFDSSASIQDFEDKWNQIRNNQITNSTYIQKTGKTTMDPFVQDLTLMVLTRNLLMHKMGYSNIWLSADEYKQTFDTLLRTVLKVYKLLITTQQIIP